MPAAVGYQAAPKPELPAIRFAGRADADAAHRKFPVVKQGWQIHRIIDYVGASGMALITMEELLTGGLSELSMSNAFDLGVHALVISLLLLKGSTSLSSEQMNTIFQANDEKLNGLIQGRVRQAILETPPPGFGAAVERLGFLRGMSHAIGERMSGGTETDREYRADRVADRIPPVYVRAITLGNRIGFVCGPLDEIVAQLNQFILNDIGVEARLHRNSSRIVFMPVSNQASERLKNAGWREGRRVRQTLQAVVPVVRSLGLGIDCVVPGLNVDTRHKVVKSDNRVLAIG